MAIKSNKGEITAWRLPKISKPPGLADILALAEQAAHRKDHPVNMRWMFGNPSRSYCLTASSTGLGTSEGLVKVRWHYSSLISFGTRFMRLRISSVASTIWLVS